MVSRKVLGMEKINVSVQKILLATHRILSHMDKVPVTDLASTTAPSEPTNQIKEGDTTKSSPFHMVVVSANVKVFKSYTMVRSYPDRLRRARRWIEILNERSLPTR